MLRTILSIALAAAVPPAGNTSIGSVHSESPGFASLVPADAKVEVLADGFTWTEGPVWILQSQFLLLSDPPKNRMYRWVPGEHSASVFLEPSGGRDMRGFREAGSNGLKPAGPRRLLVADEGNRAIALLDLRSKTKRLLVQRYDGKKLNSPNDVAIGPDGAIWFTDPPYGLEGVDDSPKKEQAANRVYRLGPDGHLRAAVSELRYPNGIAFSPNGRTLYVSNSDPKNAIILAFDVTRTGALSHRRIFANMNGSRPRACPGCPMA
jgi:gluconolactonase